MNTSMVTKAAAISSSPFPGKKGIGIPLGKNNCTDTNVKKVLAVSPYWTYGWGYDGYTSLKNSEGGKDILWVPMSWGYSSKLTSAELTSAIEAKGIPDLISEGEVKVFFGFNEPDESKQSNMSVTSALRLWHALQDLNVPLVSPSCAHPNGEWMEKFMHNVTYCKKRVDYLGVHWYGGCNHYQFRKQMNALHDKYNLPIVITEFSPADWSASCPEENCICPSEVLEFMKLTLPWLEETEWIVAYSWFSFSPSSKAGCSSCLFDEDGNLTAVGMYYKSVRSDQPDGDKSIQALEGKFCETGGKALQQQHSIEDDDDICENRNPKGRMFGEEGDILDKVCGMVVCGAISVS